MNNPSIARYIAAREQILGEVEGRWSLKRLFRNWKSRRQVKRLPDLDTRLLDDIGVNRAELDWAVKLPLTVNSALALEDRSYRRRKEERHMWL